MRREVTAGPRRAVLRALQSVVAEIAAEGRLRLGDTDGRPALWAACHGLVSLRDHLKNPARGNQARADALMLDGLFRAW